MRTATGGVKPSELSNEELRKELRSLHRTREGARTGRAPGTKAKPQPSTTRPRR